HQTSAFLFEVDGKQVFTVISNNGVQSVQLTGTGNQFQQALEDAVKSETKKVEDPS
ncbi:flagellar motor switch protein FliN, partial [Bacillus subtilis subsp. spizizenii ATCC 6633 = JCM 2499]|nr:flagellar motor switch protein FliN [Bacillus spizizenii ATCC 6633 = JCM 2499]